MKKIRFIIAIVTVALLVMGVGYAAWSQTLPVTVSGSLYTFKPVLYDVRAISGAPDQWHEVFSIAADKKSATITAPKLYPGRTVTYAIYFANESPDMNARLTGVDFSAMTGQRSSIVDVKYSFNNSTPVVVSHAGQHFEEDFIVPPSGINAGGAFLVTISVPAEETAWPYGTDNSFSFTVTPTFVQVNP